MRTCKVQYDEDGTKDKRENAYDKNLYFKV